MEAAFERGTQGRRLWKRRLSTVKLTLTLLLVLLWMRCCSLRDVRPDGARDTSGERDAGHLNH